MRVAWFLLTVPVLAGCGASPAAKAPPAATHHAAARLTLKAFTTEGNLVCLRSDRRVYRLGALSRNPVGWAKVAGAASLGIAEMKKLRPPLADQPRFHHLIVLAERLADEIVDVHGALVSRSYAAARNDQAAARILTTKIHAQAQKLGLTFCQQALTNWPA
ncbi:MAG TPA: hypothetical protein VF094_00355 [Gaiellaceae bacterium]